MIFQQEEFKQQYKINKELGIYFYFINIRNHLNKI